MSRDLVVPEEFIAWYQRLPIPMASAPSVQFITLAVYKKEGTKFMLFKDVSEINRMRNISAWLNCVHYPRRLPYVPDQVIRAFNIPESTLRSAMDKYKVDMFKEERQPVLAAYKAVSPDVKAQANSINFVRLGNVISLSKRLPGIDRDVEKVSGRLPRFYSSAFSPIKYPREY